MGVRTSNRGRKATYGAFGGTSLGHLELLNAAVQYHEISSCVGHATDVVVGFQGLVDCPGLIKHLESFRGLDDGRRKVMPLSLGRREVSARVRCSLDIMVPTRF